MCNSPLMILQKHHGPKKGKGQGCTLNKIINKNSSSTVFYLMSSERRIIPYWLNDNSCDML